MTNQVPWALIQKAFNWALVGTGHLIEKKTTKNVTNVIKFFLKLLSKLITKILPFFLSKLLPSLNWVFQRTLAAIRNFSSRMGAYLDWSLN